MRIILLLLCVWSSHGEGGAKKCARPELARGFIVPQLVSYKHDSVVHYGCDKGLKPAIKSWLAELKCDNSKWSHTPECIPQSACIATEVLHAQPMYQLKKWYSNNTEVDYVCDSSYEFAGTDKAICTDGKWTLPECIKKEYVCDPPARVDNAVILEPYKDVFEHRAKITYICKRGYKMEQKYTECYLGKWTPEVKCGEDRPAPEEPKQSVPHGHTDEDRSSARETLREDDSPPILIADSRPSHVSLCRTYPTIEHGDVIEQPDGMALSVQCAILYKLEGTNQVKCVNKEWTALPVCKAPCKLDQTLFYYPQPEYIQHGDHRQVYCRDSSHMYYKCNNGQPLYYGCGRRDW